MENQTNSQNKPVVQYVLIALLVLISGVGIFLALENRDLKVALSDCGVNSNEIQEEKVEVMQSLQDLASEYDSLMTDNDSINDEMLAQKDRVDNLLAEAKANKWSVYKLKKEASTLREIMKGYVRTIDSLNTENIELRAENIDVTKKLGDKESENNQLKESKASLEDKVRLGAKLSALDMVVYAQRVRKNNVHKETTRADKAEKMKACFTIDKNEVIEPGKKVVYLRIITPGGTILAERSDNAHMFNFEGTKGLYSVTKEVNYENEELDLCMYWDVTDALSPGEYLIKAYVDGLEIGGTSLTLK